MAGLFGLFGKKDKDGEDYFLDPDAAQAFGNAEFMRRQQEVKKTFPKISGGKPTVPPKISPKASFDTPKSSKSSTSSFTPSTPAETPTGTPTQRRKADSNMDMFRDMAKNLNK
ncbi:MAG: hypothetical protein WBA13_17580 [Microcoleaceae cyanobacterium]